MLQRLLILCFLATVFLVTPAQAERPFKVAWGVSCDKVIKTYGKAGNFTMPMTVNNKPRYQMDFLGIPARVEFDCLDGSAFKVGRLGTVEVIVEEYKGVEDKKDAEDFCIAFAESLAKLYGGPYVYSASFRWETGKSFVTLRCGRKGKLITLTYDSAKFFNDKGLRIK
ncbi:hypothetical protein [Magnetospira sp. QH-2]|uniref:hypothetical protein n=1 Tax=Magnetospira sp. (strain QH-2) TaxID=1288970 RepID=UPI0003E816A8|nr:hypothetical protein [Magnetospira sp. QH-2]CCQ74575.1 exported protein of unknown function [Magnetospira sp. QH-2]